MWLAATQQRFEAWLGRADARPAPWLAGFALALALQISPLWYAAPDAAAYLSIARSIAAGGPLARFGLAELSYPLGYPLLISPAFLAGPRPFLALSVLNWLMAVAFMLGVYCWARRQLGAGALWVTGLVMANMSVWTLYRRTLSEAAFLAVMMWAVNGLNAVLARSRSVAVAPLLAAAALLITLTAIREVGILFGAGFVLVLLTRAVSGATSRRATATAVAVTAAALLFALLSIRPERIAAAGPALAGNLAGYRDADSAVVGGVAERALLRVSEVGQLLVPGMFRAYGRGWADVNSVLYVLLLIAVGIGWWRLVRLRRDVLAFTAPLYLGAHLLWPYSAGTRYMVPLLPLLVACIWVLLEPLRRWRLGIVAVALFAHLFVAVGYWLAVDRPAARACARQWPAVRQLAAHIAPQPGAVSATDAPPCLPLLLALQLERPVQRLDPRTPADAATQWIVAARNGDAIAGFQTQADVGDYRLLRKN